MTRPNQGLADVREKRPSFFCVGSNHRTAPIGTREQFYLSPEQIKAAITNVSKSFNIDEIVIISTCNRCEVIGLVSDHEKLSPNFLYELYKAVHSEARDTTAFSPIALSQSLYVLTGIDAVRHAFHVASSLDSLVPGETQITAQFKEAMNLAKNAGTMGSMLNRLSQEALATAKKVRTNTDIGRHKVSIAHAAIDLARRASDNLSDLSFLIIGAGEMSRVAAEYAASYKPRELIIANRTSQKAFELSQHIGFGESHGLENLSRLIARADVVISATGASSIVVTKEHVQNAMKARGASPLFLIDIALPRDIAPEASKIDDVYLFDIDDLKSVVEAHIEKRREALRAASSIVSESVGNFEAWLSSKELAPTLSASSQYFNEICKKEATKTLSKDLFSNLSDKQRDSIYGMLDAIASKITSDVALALRKSSDEESRNIAAALDSVFKKD